MQGQLWQPCLVCGTQPVCVDCEHCERHCACTPLTQQPVLHPPEARDERHEAQTQAWKAFIEGLPPYIMCEGGRLDLVQITDPFPTPVQPPSLMHRTYHRGLTPSGRELILCFYGNAVIAHGADAALDEVVLAAFQLTPASAFGLLAAEVALNEFRQQADTSNRDTERLLRVLGHETVVQMAQSAQIIRAYFGMHGPTPQAAVGEREVQARYGLDIEWVQHRGLVRWDAQAQLEKVDPTLKDLLSARLFQSDDGKRWYVSGYTQTQWFALSPELAEVLRPLR